MMYVQYMAQSNGYLHIHILLYSVLLYSYYLNNFSNFS